MMSGYLIGQFQEFMVSSFIQACDLLYVSAVVSSEKLNKPCYK